MFKKANQIAALTLGLTLGLTACSKDKAEETTTATNGDPMALVAGTAMFDLPLPQYLFVENTNWAMDVKGFAELQGVNLEAEFKGNVPDVLGQNPIAGLTAYEPYRMTKSQRGTFSVVQPSNSSSLRVDFRPVAIKSNGVAVNSLEVEQIVLNGVDLFKKEDYRVLHTSYSANKDAFSILIYSSKPGNRRLVALYFYRWTAIQNDALAGAEATTAAKVKPDETAATTTPVAFEKPFNYTYGQSYKTVWDQHVVVNICGNLSAETKNTATDALDQWKNAVDGALNLDYAVSEVCPPFSDLQSQTYTYIDGWTEPNSAWGRTTGKTVTVANFSTGKILDGDVFVYMTELQKTVPQNVNVHDARAFTFWEVKQDFTLTATKEIGHLLGLGQAENGIPSVMTSDKNRTGVTENDREAILSLYPSTGFGNFWNKYIQ